MAARESVTVSRRLPLAPDALRVALLFLAVDTISGSRRWTLGPLGALEIDTEFRTDGAQSGGVEHRSTTHGHLSAPDGYTVPATIVLTTGDDGAARLSLRADARSARHREPLTIAARAGLTELVEELRFFGTRQGALN
ncbi:MAG TPA: hypothetical protein VH914_10145 [Acidimicrobiia bacterium]|nr:hypothetical protein [Acidimicrobiia bacterium]